MSDLIFVDTETTGLLEPIGIDLEYQPHMFEICIFRTNKKLKIIDKYQDLIKIPVPIPIHISRITGVYDEMLINKKPFKKHFKAIQSIMRGAKIFVAHNATFDESIIENEFERLNKTIHFPPVKYCTVEQTMHIKGYRLKLLEALEELTGETFIENQHRAKYDTKALIKIYKKLNSTR